MPSNTSTPHAKRFLSVNDVAEELGVSTKHVRRMIARGDLRIYRFGKVIRIAGASAASICSCFVIQHVTAGPFQKANCSAWRVEGSLMKWFL
jgi:excisionase family DNA binding protein